MPKLKDFKFETAIIERYKRRETSVEEALIEMYLAAISVRRVEDISEAENCSVLIAIGVDKDSYHEILGACEDLKEDTDSWKKFFVW